MQKNYQFLIQNKGRIEKTKDRKEINKNQESKIHCAKQ